MNPLTKLLVAIPTVLLAACAKEPATQPNYVHTFEYALNGKVYVLKARLVCSPTGSGFSEGNGRFYHGFATEGGNDHATVRLTNGWVVFYRRNAPCMSAAEKSDSLGTEVLVRDIENPKVVEVMVRNSEAREEGQQFKVIRSEANPATYMDNQIKLAEDTPLPNQGVFLRKQYGLLRAATYFDMSFRLVPSIADAVSK